MALSVNQIHGIVNSVAKQAWGSEAITATDLTGIISMGDKIIDSQTDKDKFLNTLVNRIGLTIIANRQYTGAMKNVVKNTFEYGSILQKIYVKPFEAQKNNSWDITKGTAIDLGVVTPPEAEQYLFEVKDVFQFTVSIPDYQLNTAFTSSENLASFISAIWLSMETSIEQALENMINMCISNFIAEKIDYQKNNKTEGVHAVNLLSLFNKSTGQSLSPEEAITDLNFLRFAGRVIKLHISRIQKLTTIYNTKKLVKHTSQDKLNVFLLADYASANATYLQSATFHKELVDLPNYTEVSHWQGMGKNAELSEVSRVNITTSTGKVVDKKYIIGLICDDEALGVMYNRRKATSFYAPNQEITQFWEKLDMGYFNDLGENGVVFYLENEVE